MKICNSEFGIRNSQNTRIVVSIQLAKRDLKLCEILSKSNMAVTEVGTVQKCLPAVDEVCAVLVAAETAEHEHTTHIHWRFTKAKWRRSRWSQNLNKRTQTYADTSAESWNWSSSATVVCASSITYVSTSESLPTKRFNQHTYICKSRRCMCSGARVVRRYSLNRVVILFFI